MFFVGASKTLLDLSMRDLVFAVALCCLPPTVSASCNASHSGERSKFWAFDDIEQLLATFEITFLGEDPESTAPTPHALLSAGPCMREARERGRT